MKLLIAATLFAAAAPAMAQDTMSTTTTTTTESTTSTGEMQAQPAMDPMMGMSGSTGMDASTTSTTSGGMSGGAMAGGEMPTCSATVRDRCVQPGAAERVAAAEYRGGGKDNSAMIRSTTRTTRKPRG